ncbi:hypothetical protein ATK74_1405 [Propionicimonas paludicola]|uniref:Uncharacterized protein n=2 Tax=Propionicimonas paludicola TaxID=185243 RepID=A0A2A9CT84_9ACTN|nr:hypothetical protein ATK74_1405 [Propionicimonas paludicola]
MTRLLDAIEEQFGAIVHLEDDLYWNVPLSAATAVYDTPELDMGSVVDDAASVGEFLGRPDEPVFIWHEAEHLAGILRSIARLDLPPA